MKRFMCASAILFLPLLLGSCSSNSAGGYTIGVEGSPAWHQTAPTADKHAYFDRKSVVELCNEWAENYPGGRTRWKDNRNLIGDALTRKGLNAMHCANPQADEMNVLRDQVNKVRRQACETQKEVYRQCLENTESIYSWTCERPKC